MYYQRFSLLHTINSFRFIFWKFTEEASLVRARGSRFVAWHSMQLSFPLQNGTWCISGLRTSSSCGIQSATVHRSSDPSLRRLPVSVHHLCVLWWVDNNEPQANVRCTGKEEKFWKTKRPFPTEEVITRFQVRCKNLFLINSRGFSHISSGDNRAFPLASEM